MKILLLSPYSPYPFNHGSAHRIHHILNSLQSLNFDVEFICNDYSEFSKDKESYFKKYSGTSVRVKAKHFFLRQNNIHLLNIFLKKLKSSDVVQVEFPYFIFPVLIAKLFGKKVIVDEHNVELNFNRFTYRNHFFLFRWAISALTWISESVTLHLADRILVCSSVDGKKLSNLYHLDLSKISVVPNGVDLSSISSVKNSLAKRTFCFLGATSHGANKEALELLRDKVFPSLDTLLAKNKSSLRFLCLSKGSSSLFENSSFKHLKIICKEDFDSVSKELSGTSLCLAPILEGSGTRIKILEYLASGALVLSTSKGAEGLDLIHNKHLIIEDSLDHYSTLIYKILFGKYNNLNRITSAGFNIIKNYDWTSIAKTMKKIYRDFDDD